MAALPGYSRCISSSGSAGILPASLPPCGQDGRAPGDTQDTCLSRSAGILPASLPPCGQDGRAPGDTQDTCPLLGAQASCLHHFHHAARMAALPGSSSPGYSIGFPKAVLCSGSAGILPASLTPCGQDGRAPSTPNAPGLLSPEAFSDLLIALAEAFY